MTWVWFIRRTPTHWLGCVPVPFYVFDNSNLATLELVVVDGEKERVLIFLQKDDAHHDGDLMSLSRAL